jgi:hypothetical protein
MQVSELEAQFKEIDERSEVDSVDVSLEGDTESTGTLNVMVNERAESIRPDYVLGILESTENGPETLLNVDLSEVDVSDEYIDSMIRAAIANKDKYPQLPGAVLRQIGATQDWELLQDYTYVSRLDGRDFSLTAFAGFVYDRSSIPRIFWVIIGKDDLSTVPPLFHDLFYRNGGVLPENEMPPRKKFGQVAPSRKFIRKEVDNLFRELAKKSGVKKWRYELAYQAVRKFGGFAWKAPVI